METIGFILAASVVVALGVFIPIINKKISGKKGELEDLELKREIRLSQNWSEYLSYTTKEKIIRLTKIVADSLNMPKDKRDAIYDEYLEARRAAVAKLHITLKGDLPSQQQFASWKQMSINQLIEQETFIKSTETLTKLLTDIKVLKQAISGTEELKTNVIIAATCIQVIALVLLELARL